MADLNDFATATGALIKDARWKRPTDTTTTDLDNYTTEGLYAVTRTGVANRPVGAGGQLEVAVVGTTITHRWTTLEAEPRIFVRRRADGVWGAWQNVGQSVPTSVSSGDLDTYLSTGAYRVTASAVTNKPTTGLGFLEVMVMGTGSTLQRWTPYNSTVGETWIRHRVNSAWTAWSRTNFATYSLQSGTDLNTITAPGQYPTASATLTNAPVQSVGVLTVGAVASIVFQTFQPLDGVIYTRARESGAWRPWSRVGGEGDESVLAARPGASLEGAGLTITDPTIAPVTAGYYPVAISDDGSTVFNGESNVLRKSTDGGVNWTTVYTFPATFTWVRQMHDGELLAQVGNAGAAREVWRSTGYASGGTVTFAKVHQAASVDVYFAAAWSLYIHGQRVVLGEYGPKYGNGSSGTGTAADADSFARYVYQSLDGGKTWSTVFDLKAHLAGLGISNPIQQHVHGVCYDPYWDRLWVTWGDDTNGLAYSDDNGATWTDAFFGPRAQSPYQCVGIIALPNCILLGTDTAPNGVMRVDRRHGKVTEDGTYPIEQAWTINDSGLRTHLCQGSHRVPGAGGRPDLWLIGWSAETNPGESVVVGTWDGFGFSTVYRHGVKHAAGQGLRSIVARPDGEVIIGMVEGGARSTVRGTSWTVSQQRP